MSRRVDLGPVSSFTTGVHIVPHSGPAPFRSLLVLSFDGEFRAFWNVCQHLPVPLDGGTMIPPIQGDHLVCLTHGARYRTTDGFCVEGPCAGKSLVRIDVGVENGNLYAYLS